MEENRADLPSRQEMFDRAYSGLRAQGFEICGTRVHCVYEDLRTGRRCAWGHVDPSLHAGDGGTVIQLRHEKRGLAALLDEEGLRFALELQRTHDNSDNPDDMRDKLLRLAERYLLTVPG